MPQISDYDKYKYDYTRYWQDDKVERSYEHRAEEIALAKLLPKKCDWFCDLGAGFGRLFPIYKNRAKNIILADYSIEGLKKFLPNNSNVYRIALNAYHLPFRDDSMDCLMSIRLIHHIVEPKIFVAELGRVIGSGGNLVLEFANKKHFLAQIRYLLGRRKINPFNEKPEKHGDDLFYNFHPKHIEKLLREIGFRVRKSLSVSNFRHQIFKELPRQALLGLENISQSLLSPIAFGPSIFLQAEKRADLGFKIQDLRKIEDILCCPKCKGELKFGKNKIDCVKCGLEFQIIDSIYDFRI